MREDIALIQPGGSKHLAGIFKSGEHVVRISLTKFTNHVYETTPEMEDMEASVFLPLVGKAKACAISTAHSPTPLRFVWHHIMPKACGGKSTPDNLVSLCDSCHYAVHALLWDLKQHDRALTIPSPVRNRNRVAYAHQGYDAAKAAGTLAKITNEGTA